MNRLLLLGMDLSGKSSAASELSRILNRRINSNILSTDKTNYNQLISIMRAGNLSDAEKIKLFEIIYKNDLCTFYSSISEQRLECIQDNLGIVRNIAYFYCTGHDVSNLITLLKYYPSVQFSFYLTCNKEERLKRLEERNKIKKEDIYEILLREHPQLFHEIDFISCEIYRKIFNGEIIDNSNLTEEETVQLILKRVNKR